MKTKTQNRVETQQPISRSVYMLLRNSTPKPVIEVRSR